MDFHRGTFRVRGDVVEVFPAYEDERPIRIEFFGDEIERIPEIDPLRGRVLRDAGQVVPSTRPCHYVTAGDELRARPSGDQGGTGGAAAGTAGARTSSSRRSACEQRTIYDLEMMKEMGYCQGIENYSRHLTAASPGSRPTTLLDYFPEDFILFMDESHVAIPQLRGMYRGDRSRKETLVDYGFRLPSALDNRPLRFEEFEAQVHQTGLRLRHARRLRTGTGGGPWWWSR